MDSLKIAERNYQADDSEENARKLIIELMRVGKISENNIKYCAVLGDELCASIFPEAEWEFIAPYLKTGMQIYKIKAENSAWLEEILERYNRKFNAEFALWCLLNAKSTYILEIITSFQNWVTNPTEETLKSLKKRGYHPFLEGYSTYLIRIAEDKNYPRFTSELAHYIFGLKAKNQLIKFLLDIIGEK